MICKISIYNFLPLRGIKQFFLWLLLINVIGANLVYANNFLLVSDSDSVVAKPQDTIVLPESNKSALESKVIYTANDSIRFDIEQQKAYLFGNAEVIYESTILKAGYIELDMGENIVFAKSLKDSAGKEIGKPIFNDDGQEFSTETITYNFETKKGLITKVITKEGEGYIHSDTAKKFEDNMLFIKNGAYTTCDNQNPHFVIKSPKIKIIPDDKIITGPAYLSIANIPTPLAVPFGLFPNKKGRASGVLIPTYGESRIAGFFLKEGGYYLGFKDRIDLALRGDIYSKGSWGVNILSNYKKRYGYNGNISLRYSEFKFGEKELPTFSEEKDFFVTWNHNQDPKSRPNSRFSAKINAGSSTYNKFNSNTSSEYLKNTFQSNVSYSKSWAGTPYNLSVNLRHSQNTLTRKVDLNLPDVVFSRNRTFPFKPKNKAPKGKWYENIGWNYRMDASNKLSVFDSLLFTDTKYKDFNMGIKHTLPVTTSFKIFKFLMLNPSITYTNRMYLQSIEKNWIDPTDSTLGFIMVDTISGFKTAHDFLFNTNIKTKIYGMLQFKKLPIKAIRHVITPSIGFSYRPDFGEEKYGYYKNVQSDTIGGMVNYSIFDGGSNAWKGIYGTPSRGKFGSINFSISNNIEMKVKSKKDSINPTKKVKLIENLTFSTSYNLALDSMNWKPINLSGYTKIFGNIFYIRYNALFDPYILVQDSLGITKNRNVLELKANNRIARIENSNWNLSTNLKLGPDMFKKKENKASKEIEKKRSTKGTEDELQMINDNLDDYVDFSIPWSLKISYTLSYLNDYFYSNSNLRDSISDNIIQTLSFNGDINLTENWRIGFRSGYDLENKDFTYTSIDIYRDLHCWEMNFNYIPFGLRQSYNFQIKVKSSILQDLKLTRKREWYDNSFNL